MYIYNIMHILRKSYLKIITHTNGLLTLSGMNRRLNFHFIFPFLIFSYLVKAINLLVFVV